MPPRLADSDDSDPQPQPSKRVKKAVPKKKKKQVEVSGSEGPASEEEEPAPEKKSKKKKLSEYDEKRLIQELVRYCLFSEMTRKPITRALIAASVLKGNPSYFTSLFEEVQLILRRVFGMELVPLGARRDGPKTPTKSWILRSTIPQQYISKSNSKSFKELQKKPQGRADSEGLAQEVTKWEVDQGFARNWKQEEGAGYGILGVLLGLILVNGRTLTDQQMRAYLGKLSMATSTNKDTDATVPQTIASPHPLKISAHLATLVKQHYLEQVPGSGAGKVKKGEEHATTWIWGPRANVEFGEKGIADFLRAINEFKGEKSELSSEDYYKDLKRAAGGDLKSADEIKPSGF